MKNSAVFWGGALVALAPTLALAAPPRIPLAFEKNIGQARADVAFLARTDSGALFLTEHSTVLTQGTAAITLTPQGKVAHWQADAPQPGVVSYVLGKQPLKTTRRFGRVHAAGVFPGVELVYYTAQNALEFDARLAPHADPSRVKFRLSGASQATIAHNGNVTLTAGRESITLARPESYQTDAQGRRKTVASRYTLVRSGDGWTLGFSLGKYDPSRTLVIDPKVVYSFRFGGQSSESVALTNHGQVKLAGTDSTGNLYLTGAVSGTSFPQVNPIYSGDRSAFITKFSPTGQLVYSTYIGGLPTPGAFYDYAVPYSLGVDASGGVTVVGEAVQPTFPETSSLSVPANGRRLFAVRLKPDGTLAYSKILADSGDVFSTTYPLLSVRPDGTAFVGGTLAQGPGSRAYVKNNFLTRSNENPTAGYLAKLTPTGGVAWATTYSGQSVYRNASFGALAADKNGGVWFTGYSQYGFPVVNNQIDFPLRNFLSEDPFTPFQGPCFIGHLDANGGLIFASGLGFSFVSAYGLAVDSQDNAVVMGDAPGAFCKSASYTQKFGGVAPLGESSNYLDGVASDIFLMKLTPGGQPLYLTFWGGQQGEIARALAIGGDDSATFLAASSSSDYPSGPGTQPDMVHNPVPIVARLDRNGVPVYTQTFGVSTNYTTPELVDVAVDLQGNAYATGSLAFNSTFSGGPHNTLAGSIPTSSFLVKVSPTGTPLLRTYLGGTTANGTLLQTPASVVTDPLGNAFVVGHSNATNYPTVNSPLVTPPSLVNQHAFVLKVTPQVDVKLALTGIESITRSGGKLMLSAVITNRGTEDADELTVTGAKLGTLGSELSVPSTIGTLAAGQSARVTLRFPDDGSVTGTAKTLALGGSYAGGSFALNRRFTLP